MLSMGDVMARNNAATLNDAANAGLSRRQVLRGAGASGLVGLTTVALILSTETAAHAATQDNWRWCLQCEGLWFNGNVRWGRCPAAYRHTFKVSGNYVLPYAPASGQDNWRWCLKCEGLWFSGTGGAGVCPAGNGHVSRGSGNYVLSFAPAGGQDNWRWCSKCAGLWYSGTGGAGVCPAGNGHTFVGSGNYVLPMA